ncbi:unnamed protein product [Protopolystoma xenopodis]|uniref:Uncharacterized protein n=1 Tax=Protopolystoma xenopodis TaxID=117903 RepID=A0A448XGF5_9PLAT|nr:unnamed protein product [Protopolystoma xenopodis]
MTALGAQSLSSDLSRNADSESPESGACSEDRLDGDKILRGSRAGLLSRADALLPELADFLLTGLLADLIYGAAASADLSQAIGRGEAGKCVQSGGGFCNFILDSLLPASVSSELPLMLSQIRCPLLQPALDAGREPNLHLEQIDDPVPYWTQIAGQSLRPDGADDSSLEASEEPSPPAGTRACELAESRDQQDTMWNGGMRMSPAASIGPTPQEKRRQYASHQTTPLECV